MRKISSGTLLVVFVLVGIASVIGLAGEQMFSPGPLSTENKYGATHGGVRSHAEISNCSACHAPPNSSQTMADRCLACHTDLRDTIASQRPMHGMLSNATECRACHTEHKGAHAHLSPGLATFDHNCAAFKLTGRHQYATCASCHKNDLYKNTASACVACHTEPVSHHNRFGNDCAKCHTTTDWVKDTTALVANFDHNRTAFPLTGKHQSVACAKCHTSTNYKNTASTCASCHDANPPEHRFAYGSKCQSCHTTETFKGTVFMHKFPVNHEGSLRKGGCAICHQNTVDMANYTCAGCHRHSDERTARDHRKLNVTLAEIADCTRCHMKNRKPTIVLADVPGTAVCAAGTGASECPLGETSACGANGRAGATPLAAFLNLPSQPKSGIACGKGSSSCSAVTMIRSDAPAPNRTPSFEPPTRERTTFQLDPLSDRLGMKILVLPHRERW